MRSGRIRVAVMAVVVLLMPAASAVPVAAQVSAGPADGLDELRDVRARLAAVVRRSEIAEGRRRIAEERVVDAYRERAEARAAFDAIAARLQVARELRTLREAEFARAQARFDDQVANSYMYTGGSNATLLLQAMQSARDAHDAARLIHELDSILGHSHEDLRMRAEAVALAEGRVTLLLTMRSLARDRLIASLHERRDAIDAVPPTRVRAQRAEQAVLDAAAASLDAESAALLAGGDPEAIRAIVDPLAFDALAPDVVVPDPLDGGSAPVDEATGPDLEQRREWLANRREVLAAEARLDDAAWEPRVDLACPVAPATFSDDFHLPRSHGRRHLGIDMLATRGLPIRAMADGVVNRVDIVDAFDGDHDLGGVSVSYTAGEVRFFAAHLDRVAPGIVVGDSVRRGQVIGYVGDSGNAVGGPPHLHLGMSIDGAPINPFLTVGIVCP